MFPNDILELQASCWLGLGGCLLFVPVFTSSGQPGFSRVGEPRGVPLSGSPQLPLSCFLSRSDDALHRKAFGERL